MDKSIEKSNLAILLLIVATSKINSAWHWSATMISSIPLLWSFLFLGVAQANDVPDISTPVMGTESPTSAAAILHVEEYVNVGNALGTESDAAIFQAAAMATMGIPERNIITNSRGDRSKMRRAVRSAAGRVSDGGTLWVYFSGHGFANEDGWFLLGKDTRADGTRINQDGISIAEIEEWGASENIGNIVLVLDATFSGRGRNREPVLDRAVARLEAFQTENERLTVWSADQDMLLAPIWETADQGLFTWMVTAAIRGWADGSLSGETDGTVTLYEAQAWVRQQNTRLARRHVSSVTDDKGIILSAGDLETPPSDDIWTPFERVYRGGTLAQSVRQIREHGAEAFQAAMEIEDDELRIQWLENFITEYERPTAQVTVGVWVPEMAEATQVLYALRNQPEPVATAVEPTTSTELVETETEPAVVEEATVVTTSTENSTIAPPASTRPPGIPPGCSDLLAIEPFALMGRLGGELRQCLEERIGTVELQTEKKDISRVLMVDADARRDSVEMLRLMGRHLEDIDRSDPDLCFTYALSLSRLELGRAEEAIRWADYALENKQEWRRETYESRVYNLFRLKTETANKLWVHYNSAYVVDRDAATSEVSELWRNNTKQFAREWLDYAFASQQETSIARTLCITAAGTTDFCEEREE
jgi:hypothetical protein